jgi:hypothetical protein
MSQDPEEMAKVTRQHAEREDADQRTPAGSHDMPSSAQDDDYEHQHQQGAGQSDDVTGKAPVSGMARQHANPARR